MRKENNSSRKILFKKALKAIDEYRMLDGCTKVLVAVSGGPDSTALLRFMLEIRGEYGFKVGVFHLNHLLREESDSDEKFVKQLVKTFGLKGYFYRYDVRKTAEEKGISVEEAGRLIRYRLLEEISGKFGYERVALAHTFDDFVETVVLRFITNSNFESLSGIPARRGKIIRPLIYLTKKEITAYLDEINQDYCIDRTNLSEENLRALIRNRIIPALKEINPSFEQNVFELGKSVQEAAKTIDSLAEKSLKRLFEKKDGFFEASLSKLKKLEPAVRSRTFYKVLLEAGISPKKIARKHIDFLNSAFERTHGLQLGLPDGVEARTIYGFLRVGRFEDSSATISEKEFLLPGIIEIPEANLKIRCELSSEIPPDLGDGKYDCVVDAEEVGSQIKVRSWKPGDKMQIFGMRGTKKIQDIFVDEKVPEEKRHLIPVFTDKKGEIFWLYGFRISEKVRVKKGAKKVYIFETIE